MRVRKDDTGHLELRALRQEPRQELLEAGGRVVVAHGGRRAAGGAPPPLSPRRGPAVPLRRTTAARAFDRLHDPPLPEGF